MPVYRRGNIIMRKPLLRLLYMLLMLPLALPVVLIIRFLRPFVVIRFGKLISERIGHFAANTEVYLCERDVGINATYQPFIDIWHHMPIICNAQLERMWKRILHIWPTTLVEPVDRLSRLLPGRKAHVIPWRNHQGRDVNGVLVRVPPHLTFLPEEEELGQAGLRALGVAQKKPFVCFHNRDSAYMDRIFYGGDWQYHDYRNSKIQNYLLAAEQLALRGYYVIRMGAVVKETLSISSSRIIDYATNGYRNDFMDIYLGAKCTFFITSGTGIDAVPEIFRRALVIVNYVPLEHVRSWNTNYLTIFKKHWLRKEHRFMTFREILESGAGRYLQSHQFETMGIELIENTPEEIAAVAIEMDERLKGTWQTTDEDEEMQQRFWARFPTSELHGTIVSRIGAEFLRQHQDWLL